MKYSPSDWQPKREPRAWGVIAVALPVVVLLYSVCKWLSWGR